jgi:formate hydrogenlyase subunit 3/multisubunit Na+/H+ antiporter MnhD subunit
MRITLFTMLLVSGLLSTIALSRAGLRHFWSPHDRAPPRLRIIECLPITLLLLACAALAIRPEPVLRYTRDAAQGSMPSRRCRLAKPGDGTTTILRIRSCSG